MKQGIDDRNYAVLDSACSSSVCGEKWFSDNPPAWEHAEVNSVNIMALVHSKW